MDIRNKQRDIQSQFSDYQERFLLEYFKEMRAEINLRIKNHTSLVWAKIVTTGVLMSFLLVQDIDPRIKISGLAFVPVIAILYDIMIAQNLRAVHKIGHFIRNQLEDVVFPHFQLWENYAGQRSINARNYGPVDIFLLIMFTFGTMLITFYLLWIHGSRQFAIVFGVLSLVVITWLIGFMRRYIMFFEGPRDVVSARESLDPQNA
jgi:hypothetical protein